jgi:asparagine synthase (glutamine-hydrolysing)
VVTAAEAQGIVPDMGAIYDEPFADASGVPTWLLSGMARRNVKVCLTGDGGDEMFGGYVRYTGVPRLWKAFSGLPGRALFAGALEAAPLPLIDGALGFLGPLARRYASRGELGPSVRKAAGWMRARSEAELYERTMMAWPDPEAVLMGAAAPITTWRPDRPAFDNPVEGMLWRDSVDYLPGDILAKVDRASMAHGLETRAPFLDPEIATLAWRAAPALKIRGGEGKWLVKQVLRRYVPPALTDRPKVGFSVPLHAWLTGALKPWARDLLSPERLKRAGVFKPDVVERAWSGLLAGDSGLAARVWTVLMFESWQAARGR